MAFNFNWSPLIADTDRVRDMLTNALNKSPKPPIIVDDIVVNELNLGSTPPELEILEIGDLADDRFRGIFKMSYAGDAYLTLKTRVQANPLNTYLSTKPSFASPQPLAANSSLTIPIQITLSDIRLSGFVILVFSKQKGVTIVFRNDPLEKLKVSSTFDSIPFVRDYLQKTIENQLRILFMEDLPAIIHRLSLRVFDPQYQTAENQEPKKPEDDSLKPIDPFASPAQQGIDGEDDLGAPFSLDPPAEMYASFSQKNMIRLATLTESQRTLSLFTPSIRDTVYRAWASAAQREESSNGTNTPSRPVTLSRLQSSIMSHGTQSCATSQVSGAGSEATRPSFASMHTGSVYSLGSSASRTRPKKRKNRVVNLRKNKADNDTSEVASTSSGYDDSASRTHSDARSSVLRKSTEESTAPSSAPREGEITTPPRSPQKKRVGFNNQDTNEINVQRSRPRTPAKPLETAVDTDPTPRQSMYLPEKPAKPVRPSMNQLPRMQSFPSRSPSPELRRSSAADIRRSSSELKLQHLMGAFNEGSSGGILEQAWMQKMATEIARKVEMERAKQRAWPSTTSEDDLAERSEAPPAYVS
ncbi:Mitochondrial distribution and morphology protein 34 [Fulvia fulva]|uniref:Mitochondrial distribution and morphology protein 34 n=1 Tax=Passalora fulva TaxID=5499 RepID=A0A9Q8LIP9_PASFU|nr:Mitochondrial distribution and morphology protein 34 [Fulvia fulva]UJO18108.1 Mitochondrial distribution and morphology protein 34 [Fulvia fulva]WPV15325.1 Mitochondrial distribution and morphology protein 34 [Fulvia fulva]